MIGNTALYLGFFTAIIAAAFFGREPVNKAKTVSKVAISFYYTHVAVTFLASLFLLYNLLTHRFQYIYVYAHTDLSLPTTAWD